MKQPATERTLPASTPRKVILSLLAVETHKPPAARVEELASAHAGELSRRLPFVPQSDARTPAVV